MSIRNWPRAIPEHNKGKQMIAICFSRIQENLRKATEKESDNKNLTNQTALQLYDSSSKKGYHAFSG
jgi:hypothetical protein